MSNPFDPTTPTIKIGRIRTRTNETLGLTDLVLKLWACLLDDLRLGHPLLDRIHQGVERLFEWYRCDRRRWSMNFTTEGGGVSLKIGSDFHLDAKDFKLPTLSVVRELETISACLLGDIDRKTYIAQRFQARGFTRKSLIDLNAIALDRTNDEAHDESQRAVDTLLQMAEKMYGPIGVRWLVPILWAMYEGYPNIVAPLLPLQYVAVAVPCYHGYGKWPPLYDGLPSGCDMIVRKWVITKAEAPLYTGILNYTLNVICAQNRRNDDFKADFEIELSNTQEEQCTVYCLTMAGMPVAIALVDPRVFSLKSERTNWIEINYFCALSNQKYGTTLMQYLQDEADGVQSGLILTAVPSAVSFYEKLGFTLRNPTYLRRMCWMPPLKKGSDSTYKRTKRV